MPQQQEQQREEVASPSPPPPTRGSPSSTPPPAISANNFKSLTSKGSFKNSLRMSRRGHSMKIDSHHQQAGVPPAVSAAAAFNFDQMHNTIDNIEASAEVPKKSSRSKHVTDMSSAEAIHVASSAAANGKAIEAAGINSSNGKLVASEAAGVPSGGNPVKKEKYKSLWGKVGKHGLMQAAASKNQDSASSSSSTGSASNRNKRGSATNSGWDQVLQPIMQKQRASETMHYNYHAQQVQMGSASMGSGWTGANMECDCGEDSCPRCNLLLSMGDDQQW